MSWIELFSPDILIFHVELIRHFQGGIFSTAASKKGMIAHKRPRTRHPYLLHPDYLELFFSSFFCNLLLIFFFFLTPLGFALSNMLVVSCFLLLFYFGPNSEKISIVKMRYKQHLNVVYQAFWGGAGGLVLKGWGWVFKSVLIKHPGVACMLKSCCI